MADVPANRKGDFVKNITKEGEEDKRLHCDLPSGINKELSYLNSRVETSNPELNQFAETPQKPRNMRGQSG